MKLQLLAFAALASVIAATSAKAQYALSPYGPQAPAPLVLGSGIEPVPAPYYDAAVVPAGSMAAGGWNSSAACDTAGCGCGSGGAMTGLLAGWFNGSSACGGSCGGSKDAARRRSISCSTRSSTPR